MGTSTGNRKRANGAGGRYFRTTTRGTREAVASAPRVLGQATIRVGVTVPDLGPRPTKRQRDEADRQAMALAEERLALRLANPGGPADTNRATVKRFADHWLEMARYSGRRPRTLGDYAYRIGIITDAIGTTRLADLDREHVRRVWDACNGDALRQAVHRTLKVLLRAAVDEDYPVTPSVLRLKGPSYEQPEAPTMAPAQAAAFLAAIPPDAHPWPALFRVLYVAGLRGGEVCGLVWGDLDEVNGALRLVAQVGRDPDGTWCRTELKSSRQRRTIALDTDTLALLAEHRKGETARGRGKPADWLFWRPTGRGPVERWLLYRTFKDYAKAAGLPAELRPHSVRSGTAMSMLEAGSNLDTVSRRLGHAKLDTTTRFYTRQSADLDREAAEQIASRIVKAPQTG